MIEKDGKDREAGGSQPVRNGVPMAGECGRSPVPIRVCFFIPNSLGFSLVSISLLPTSVPPQPLHLAPQPVPSPLLFIGSWLAPGFSSHSSFWPLAV